MKTRTHTLLQVTHTKGQKFLEPTPFVRSFIILTWSLFTTYLLISIACLGAHNAHHGNVSQPQAARPRCKNRVDYGQRRVDKSLI